MSSVLSSIDQAACTPWEIASFDGDPKAVKAAPPSGVRLPTIEQISAIQEQARQEGYQAGQAEGYAAGQQKAVQEATRLRNLANAFSSEISEADEAISEQILDLSIDFAHAVLKTALEIRPELVIPIVKEAVRYLPAVQQPALLFLHPDDVVLVKERIGDELTKMGWQVADDAQVKRGGCRIETGSNQIDASLPTRWQRLAASLSRESEWLAP